MHTQDRPQSSLPVLAVRPALPIPTMHVGGRHAAAPSSFAGLAQTAWRAIVRYWWMIALAWVAMTSGLVYVIHWKVKPKYEATSLLRVEPTHRELFGTNIHSAEGFEPFLETQVQLITSPNVLIAATSDPKVSSLPFFREVADAEVELHKRLQVGVIPRTYLIRVALSSTSALEAAAIVNRVVNAYLEATSEWSDGMARSQIKNLEVYSGELRNQADELQKKWLLLAAKGNLDMIEDPLPEDRAGSASAATSVRRITIEEFKRVREELQHINIELIQSEAQLKFWEAEIALAQKGPDAEKRIKSRLLHEFRSDPMVAGVYQQIETHQRRIDDIQRISRNSRDPALMAARQQLELLGARLQRHWETKGRVLAEGLGPDGGEELARSIRDMKLRIETLNAARIAYQKMVERIEITNKQESSDSVKVTLVREELVTIREMQDAVNKRLEQLRFESKSDARISRVSEARATGMPLSDNRKIYWVASPVAVLFCVLGLFVLLELRSARVEDLDALSRLISIDVHAIPSLPELRPSRFREQRLQDFLRSLDHLRVSLCDEELGVSTGRCLLIASAVSGEGKTTLTGEFAITCARSGISTLVIDADLRRASLSRGLLDVEGPGLSGVLSGAVSPDEAVVLVPEGFHLLPAGRYGQDPGALLRGNRINELFAHFRQQFNLIIVDSPPVLPVPDALTLGRHTDGAILVARHGVSRAPNVDRARRQLMAAGIPVLKTVVNGARTSGFNGLGYYDEIDDDLRGGSASSAAVVMRPESA